jgi:hypothetical protein
MKGTFKLIGRAALGVVLLFCIQANAQTAREPKGKLLYSDDFSGNLNPKRWLAEIEPVGQSEVHTENSKLILNTAGGVTVWFKPRLERNIRIEYDWTVLVDSGRNDRLSDLNQFWMATDPRNANLFWRNGKFENYDSLSLYYVGFGGNTNSTTRFRKYHGNGQKPLLKEYLDRAHLLKANHTYHIVITVVDGRTTFSVDGEVFFEFIDPAPLRSGWFGFRSTAARHAVDGFRVWRLNQL